MPLTFKNITSTVFGDKRAVFGMIDFDSSYDSGGEAFAPSSIGLTYLDFISFESRGGYLFEYDYTNQKVKALTPTSAHTHTITILGGVSGTVAIGIESDNNNVGLSKTSATNRTGITGIQNNTAAVASEVSSGTNLSSLTNVRFMAVGS